MKESRLVQDLISWHSLDMDPTDLEFVQGQHSVVAIGDSLVLRVPRHARAASRLRRVERLTAALESRLPIAISRPRAIEEARVPGGLISVEPRLDGRPLSKALFEGLPKHLQDALLDQLAEFLLTLQKIPPPLVNAAGLANLEPSDYWLRLLERAKERLAASLTPTMVDNLTERFQNFARDCAAADLRQVLQHGDFGPGNILFSESDGRVTGVVDFEFSGFGDAAYDVASVSTLGEAVQDRFMQLMGFDERVRLRIEFYRFTFALQEALFADDTNDKKTIGSALAFYDGDLRRHGFR